MRKYTRLKTAGACYFFTVVTYNRRKILCLPEVRDALRYAINTVRQTMPFEIIAWVLLPDHLHCIWKLPENDDNYSLRWAKIKTIVTRQCKHLATARVTITQAKKRKEKRVYGRVGFGSIKLEMIVIWKITSIIFIIIQSSMATAK